MIGAHEIERPVLKHPNNRAIRPDILADQAAGACALVIEILRNAVAIHVMDGMDRLARLLEPPEALISIHQSESCETAQETSSPLLAAVQRPQGTMDYFAENTRHSYQRTSYSPNSWQKANCR